MKFLVQQDTDGNWQWELRGGLGEVVAKGAKSFKSKELLLESIHAIRATVPDTLVFDPLGGLIHASQERHGPPT